MTLTSWFLLTKGTTASLLVGFVGRILLGRLLGGGQAPLVRNQDLSHRGSRETRECPEIRKGEGAPRPSRSKVDLRYEFQPPPWVGLTLELLWKRLRKLLLESGQKSLLTSSVTLGKLLHSPGLFPRL